MSIMTFPKKRKRTLSEKILGDYVYPLMKALGLAEKKPSVNIEFLEAFLKIVKESRKKLLGDREFATMYVHTLSAFLFHI